MASFMNLGSQGPYLTPPSMAPHGVAVDGIHLCASKDTCQCVPPSIVVESMEALVTVLGESSAQVTLGQR